MAQPLINPLLTNPFAANPLMQPWADLGLRALDMMVASSQEVGDRMDRLTRATADAEPEDTVAATATEALANGGLAAASQWQSAGMQWMGQWWQQWFSFWTSLLPPPGETATVSRRKSTSSLNAAPSFSQSLAATWPSVSTAARSGTARSEGDSQAAREHAVASHSPRKRAASRKASGKPRSARR